MLLYLFTHACVCVCEGMRASTENTITIMITFFFVVCRVSTGGESEPNSLRNPQLGLFFVCVRLFVYIFIFRRSKNRHVYAHFPTHTHTNWPTRRPFVRIMIFCVRRAERKQTKY